MRVDYKRKGFLMRARAAWSAAIIVGSALVFSSVAASADRSARASAKQVIRDVNSAASKKRYRALDRRCGPALFVNSGTGRRRDRIGKSTLRVVHVGAGSIDGRGVVRQRYLVRHPRTMTVCGIAAVRHLAIPYPVEFRDRLPHRYRNGAGGYMDDPNVTDPDLPFGSGGDIMGGVSVWLRPKKR